MLPPPSRVELRVFAVPKIPFAAALPRVEQHLVSSEIEAARRFVSDAHRTLYAVSHAALRWLLARRLACAERDIEIERGEHGRPEVRGGGVRFNLSHTDGIAVIAMTTSADVGVDVERGDRPLDVARLARAVFTSRELNAFRGDRQTFFRTWTLKEAYAKARGAGLTLGFRNFAFDLAGEPVLHCEPSFDDASGWRFHLFEPLPRFVAAAAVREHSAEWGVETVELPDLPAAS